MNKHWKRVSYTFLFDISGEASGAQDVYNGSFLFFVYLDQKTTILSYLLRSCPAAVKFTYLKTSFISTDHKQRPGLWNE